MKKNEIIKKIYSELISKVNKTHIKYIKIRANKKGKYYVNQAYILGGELCFRFDFYKKYKTSSTQFGFVKGDANLKKIPKKALLKIFKNISQTYLTDKD